MCWYEFSHRCIHCADNSGFLEKNMQTILEALGEQFVVLMTTWETSNVIMSICQRLWTLISFYEGVIFIVIELSYFFGAFLLGQMVFRNNSTVMIVMFVGKCSWDLYGIKQDKFCTRYLMMWSWDRLYMLLVYSL